MPDWLLALFSFIFGINIGLMIAVKIKEMDEERIK